MTDQAVPEPVQSISPTPVSNKSQSPLLIIILVILVLFSLGTTGFMYWQNQQLTNQMAALTAAQTVKPSPAPTVTTDPTLGWKTYSNQDKDYSFKYPSTWTANSIEIHGSGYDQVFSDPEGNYTLTFSSIGNYSQLTGKPYKTIDDYVGMPYKVRTVMVDGQEARQPLPRAGSENINSVDFFSKDLKSIYTLELQTGDTPMNTPGDKIQQGQKLFDQIISTFKFTEITSTTLEPTPTVKPKTLTYSLPSGWSTVQDASGTYEVGYDPNTYHIIGSDSVLNLSVSVNSTKQFGGWYSVNISPYNGGSRHSFILQSSTQDVIPTDYHEVSYSVDNRSCLVLYGVVISQWNPIEGMCAIDNKRAFSFSLPQMSDKQAEQIISTIRLLK